jgi:para-aminobenzoate synthetase
MVVYLQSIMMVKGCFGIFLPRSRPFVIIHWWFLLLVFCIDTDLPSELEISAWSKGLDDVEQTIMGLKHKSRPIWTVQFHPESICTGYGRQIIKNFCELAKEIRVSKTSCPILPNFISKINAIPTPLVPPNESKSKQLCAIIEKVDVDLETEIVFSRLFSELEHSFWLDSARVEKGMSRFSFMGGDLEGPESYLIQYNLESRTVTKNSKNGTEKRVLSDGQLFFTELARIMHDSQVDTNPIVESYDIPFLGGLVGYLGYEMKAETLHFHQAQHPFLIKSAKHIPDSSFFFVDRLLIFDHQENSTYLVALVNNMSDCSARKLQLGWIQSTLATLKILEEEQIVFEVFEDDSTIKKIPQLTLAHEKDEYLSIIKDSLHQINKGETYEVCLTTQVKVKLEKPHPKPFTLYQHLRKRNPAPYASYLSFGNDLVITSSSPERFLKVESDRKVSMKPIKGTVKVANTSNYKGTRQQIAKENETRIFDLATGEKNRSENLMVFYI